MPRLRTLALFFPPALALAAVAACGGPTVHDLGASTAPPATQTATPTAAPTNTPAADSTCRDVTISDGKDGSGPTNTVVYISALGATSDASETLGASGATAGGPVTLCAAPANGNKSALTLLNDVVIAVSLPQSNCACAQLLADGTTGTLYGGPDPDPLDFTVTKDSAGTGAGGAATVVDGPGAVTAKGDLRIVFKARVAQLSGTCTPEACLTGLGGVAIQDLPFTTGTVVSEMTNTRQGGTVSVTVTGAPFPDWSDPAQKGSLAGGAAQIEDVSGLNQDVAEVQRVAEK